jgi:hypothetical protein
MGAGIPDPPGYVDCSRTALNATRSTENHSMKRNAKYPEHTTRNYPVNGRNGLLWRGCKVAVPIRLWCGRLACTVQPGRPHHKTPTPSLAVDQ